MTDEELEQIALDTYVGCLFEQGGIEDKTFLKIAKAVRAALATEQEAALDAVGAVVQELSQENAKYSAALLHIVDYGSERDRAIAQDALWSKEAQP